MEGKCSYTDIILVWTETWPVLHITVFRSLKFINTQMVNSTDI